MDVRIPPCKTITSGRLPRFQVYRALEVRADTATLTTCASEAVTPISSTVPAFKAKDPQT